MKKVQATGLRRIVNAAGYSRLGLIAAWQNEAAFRQECIMGLIAIGFAFWLDITPIERSLLIGSIMLIIIVELLNSAIEAVVDRIGEECHELSGRAKDIGSSAVFVSLVLAAVIWGLILFPYWFG